MTIRMVNNPLNQRYLLVGSAVPVILGGKRLCIFRIFEFDKSATLAFTVLDTLKEENEEDKR